MSKSMKASRNTPSKYRMIDRAERAVICQEHAAGQSREDLALKHNCAERTIKMAIQNRQKDVLDEDEKYLSRNPLHAKVDPPMTKAEDEDDDNLASWLLPGLKVEYVIQDTAANDHHPTAIDLGPQPDTATSVPQSKHRNTNTGDNTAVRLWLEAIGLKGSDYVRRFADFGIKSWEDLVEFKDTMTSQTAESRDELVRFGFSRFECLRIVVGLKKVPCSC